MNARRKSVQSRSREQRAALREYARLVHDTDTLPRRDLRPVLLGLFGEVGSVLAAAKKLQRERDVFVGYRETLTEELGDALWYFCALCNRLEIPVADIFATAVAENAAGGRPVRGVSPRAILVELGKRAADVLSIKSRGENSRPLLVAFARQYLLAASSSYLRLPSLIIENSDKVTGRFLDADLSKLPVFDARFDEDEQIPRQFEIVIYQRKSGKSYLQYNGVFIGYPLTDNIAERDGYRFHDVFHFAHAAILNWSPVFRALLKRKRKSDRRFDEEQDSGRAIVVEEGLTAWIFSRAKELQFFHDQRSISFDMLKTIGQFVRGYEVEQCPLNLLGTRDFRRL